LGGISRTFGGYITDLWGVYHGPLGDVSNFCMNLIWGVYHGPLGGISRTFGGYITDLWGVYHGPPPPVNPAENKEKIGYFSALNFF